MAFNHQAMLFLSYSSISAYIYQSYTLGSSIRILVLRRSRIIEKIKRFPAEFHGVVNAGLTRLDERQIVK
ncbi:hypothetical protein BofuT4_uP088160.1 [Botrytis cinerea T4]|uniref:Uncharacterized protein n=1 Tax=Botryotinia fuckeliana (strain T4) TaxID=999810 RepID=G2YG55_BOTF4|nr:hypothetical protein BofuT4_uP088160.1 [Botrytis cinerea T4]